MQRTIIKKLLWLKLPAFIVLCVALTIVIFVKYANSIKTESETTNEKMFEERMHDLIRIYNIPSISACILKRDRNGVWEIAWKGAYGKRSAVLPVFNANTETIYSIASITKVFTATAVMQLVDKGLVSLDDDINTYLPFKIRNPGLDYTNQKVPPITLRNLLSHRSGLPQTPKTFFTRHKDLMKQDFGVFMSIEEMQNYLDSKNSWAHIPADGIGEAAYYRPGETYCYSNVGYMLLGFLIEEVVNRGRDASEKRITWQDYFSENIFKPLNMRRTKFYWDFIWKFSNEAQGYIEKKYTPVPNPDYPRNDKGEPLAGGAFYAPGVPIPPMIYVPQRNSIINPTLIGARYSAGGAAGQILSTPGDLAYFLVMHLNHGNGYVRDDDGNIEYDGKGKPREVRILSGESVETMHRVDDAKLCPVKPAADGFNITGLNRLTGYGLGWARGNLGGRYWNYPWNPGLDPSLGVDWKMLAKSGIERNEIKRINGVDTGGGLETQGHTGDTYGYRSGMYRISEDLAVIYFVNVDTTGEEHDESRIQPRRFQYFSSVMDGEDAIKGFDGALPHNIVKLSEIERLLIQKAASLTN